MTNNNVYLVEFYLVVSFKEKLFEREQFFEIQIS